ncbi:MAG: cytidylate kinase family protein [Bacteroidetes bacterium]|nr:cytidylate kinase family protein [Bacteroidota bacterium]
MKIDPATKITLTGDLGSGKSVTSALLCEKTGFKYLSTGQIQRQLAAEMGLDTLELNRRADADPSIDEKIDGVFISLAHDPAGYIIDSRMAWFFLPDSFKVYLQTPVEISAMRILQDPKRNSENYKDLDEAIEKIKARKQSENARFLLKYGANSTNLNNFDLVVDTSERPVEQVGDLILRALECRQTGVPFARYV